MNWVFVTQEWDIVREANSVPVEKVETMPQKTRTYGYQIQQCRLTKRLSIEAMANELNVSIEQLKDYETNRLLPPDTIMRAIQKM